MTLALQRPFSEKEISYRQRMEARGRTQLVTKDVKSPAVDACFEPNTPYRTLARRAKELGLRLGRRDGHLFAFALAPNSDGRPPDRITWMGVFNQRDITNLVADARQRVDNGTPLRLRFTHVSYKSPQT
jgi:hypothetical protein